MKTIASTSLRFIYSRYINIVIDLEFHLWYLPTYVTSCHGEEKSYSLISNNTVCKCLFLKGKLSLEHI